MMARGMLAVALLALPLGCADRGTGATPEGSGLGRAARGLCDAIGMARTGDVQGADRAFQDLVHDELHDLADRLATSDRRASADMLVAKQRVEDALSNGEGADDVHAAMVALYGELVAAADAAGLAAPGCRGANAA